MPEKSLHLLKESRVVSIEVLDGLVNSLFGFHFIEPSITYVEKIKAKKAIIPVKKPQPTSLSLMSGFPNKSGFGKFGGLNSDLGPEKLIPLPRVKLTPTMKLAIAEFEPEEDDDLDDFT